MSNNTTYYPKGARKVTSRLAKRKQEKLARQSWVLFGLSIIILLVFGFVILPNLLGGVFEGSDGFSFTESDDIPPQTPIISAPPQATFSGQLTVSGFTEAESTVFVIVNGETQAEVTADDSGTFEQEITLLDGENLLRAYAQDEAGNESELSRSYQILVDAEKPFLELETPQDGQTIELRRNQLTDIKGTTEPRARVKVNGRLVIADADGIFETNYQLQEGENELKFEIEDQAGNTFEQSITVTFKL